MRQAVEALNEMDPEQLKRLFREVRQRRLKDDTQIVLQTLHSHQTPLTENTWPDAGQYGHAGMARQPRLRAARLGALA
jgi:hypothetical protein